MTRRIPVGDLLAASEAALAEAGLTPGHTAITAETLVEGDLLGHRTHGVALLDRYVEDLRAGRMETSGDAAVLHEEAGSARWDGRYLPGPVLVRRALDWASDRARGAGAATLAISHSHHVACLAAYLRAVTETGLVAVIASSSPNNATVAPFGAVEGVLSPNPIAAGWPTEGDPVLIDISTSITTTGMTSACAAAGRPLPGRWIVGPDGEASDESALMAADPPGALLPVGGLDHGHKGFALGLMVEMLTSGLAGRGRADRPDRWGASVFVMVLDPACHGGAAAFARQTEFMAEEARGARVAPGRDPVRLPGARALALRRDQLANGVTVSAATLRILSRLSPAFADLARI